MVRDGVVFLVLWCWRNAVLVAVVAAIAALALAVYAAGALGLDTDESRLIAADLPFKRAERAFDRVFPDHGGSLVVVIDATSQGAADQVARTLKARLEGRTDLFRSVSLPPGTEFFARNGLLYLPTGQVQALADRIIAAQPLIGSLARDPSLRGMLVALDLALEGVERGQARLAEVEPGMRHLADAAAAALTGRAEPLPWRLMFGLGGGERRQTRALLLISPVPDFASLTPGAKAAKAVREAAAGLGAKVRLTGSSALTDDNFATVVQGVEISTPLSVAAVALLLFSAVRSKRVAVAILLALAVGLAATGAFAAATVGTLNPISVAFAVMFVGIAVDFGIQFSIRIRDEQLRLGDPAEGMASAARLMVGPLSLAALTTAVGFLSFVPTAYAGVAQLGLIAGAGMLIALAVNLTLLPALLALFRPPPAAEGVELPRARPLERWLRHRASMVVAVAGALSLAGLVLVPLLRFDFNPLNLQDPAAESVQALRDLARSPETSPYGVDAVADSVEAARALARRLDALPQVDHTVTIADLVPSDQEEKLAIIADLALLLGPTLDPAEVLPPPTEDELRAALADTARRLQRQADAPGGASARLAMLLDALRVAPPGTSARFLAAVGDGLPALLADLRLLLQARPVSAAELPPDLLRRWLNPEGKARVEAMPKGDMQDARQLAEFVAAVQAVAPDAVGMPVSVVESGRVVVQSFQRAGVLALSFIALLLLFVLRRVSDVALVLLPLVMGALFTVVGAVVTGLAVNFANIIALPLLLGIGVAFNIYFVLNWRHGVRRPLSNPTSRAVLFSALTTGSAFGSLAVSTHPGTASMGLLLLLSLGLAVATTFLVLPAVFTVLDRKRAGASP